MGVTRRAPSAAGGRGGRPGVVTPGEGGLGGAKACDAGLGAEGGVPCAAAGGSDAPPADREKALMSSALARGRGVRRVGAAGEGSLKTHGPAGVGSTE